MTICEISHQWRMGWWWMVAKIVGLCYVQWVIGRKHTFVRSCPVLIIRPRGREFNIDSPLFWLWGYVALILELMNEMNEGRLTHVGMPLYQQQQSFPVVVDWDWVLRSLVVS